MPLRPDMGNGIVDDLTGRIVPIDMSAHLPNEPHPAASRTVFTIYEPFALGLVRGRRHLVMYATRPDGTRRRVGALDLDEVDAEEFVELWREAGSGFSTREELGIPGPFGQPK